MCHVSTTPSQVNMSVSHSRCTAGTLSYQYPTTGVNRARQPTEHLIVRLILYSILRKSLLLETSLGSGHLESYRDSAADPPFVFLQYDTNASHSQFLLSSILITYFSYLSATSYSGIDNRFYHIVVYYLKWPYTLLQKKRSMESCVSFWEECR